MATGAMTDEQALLDAARGGDEAAFGRLVEPYRGELHAHCYRMLGSVQDAEDTLQETLLRAWRALGRFEGRSSLRSWLYTIATNTSLNAIARRPKRTLPLDEVPSREASDGLGLPLSETVWIEPYPDEQLGLEDGYAAPEARYERRESVELAFTAALQHLPANQRAALILREVLGFSAREVADSLETTVQSVNSALQRARKSVEDKLPDPSQQETLRALGDERLKAVVDDYMDALSRGDVDKIVGMLADDAAWSMPPLTAWYTGLDSIRAWLKVGPLSGKWRWKHLPTHVTGQAAVGSYEFDDAAGAYVPFALDVLTLARRPHQGGHVVHRPLDRQRGPRLLPGLPRAAGRRAAGRGQVRRPRPARAADVAWTRATSACPTPIADRLADARTRAAAARHRARGPARAGPTDERAALAELAERLPQHLPVPRPALRRPDAQAAARRSPGRRTRRRCCSTRTTTRSTAARRRPRWRRRRSRSSRRCSGSRSTSGT